MTTPEPSPTARRVARVLDAAALPVFDRENPPFGFVWVTPRDAPTPDAGPEGRVTIAEMVWGDPGEIRVDADLGTVAIHPPDRSSRPVVVNGTLDDFVAFTEAIDAVRRRVDEIAPDTWPMHLTREEAEARLERLRSGNVPRPSPEERAARRAAERAAVRDLRALRADLKRRDAAAIRGNAFWSIVLDELRDALP